MKDPKMQKFAEMFRSICNNMRIWYIENARIPPTFFNHTWQDTHLHKSQKFTCLKMPAWSINGHALYTQTNWMTTT